MWTAIHSDQDLEHLLDVFGGFHDGCLREMHVWTGTCVDDDLSMACPDHLDTNVRVLFQRQYRDPSAIEMVFEQVVGMHLAPSPTEYFDIIFAASLIHQDETYYWASAREWTPDGPERDNVTWIAAKGVSWRDASDWMGDKLRYAPNEPGSALAEPSS
jgi:hypothetical protein